MSLFDYRILAIIQIFKVVVMPDNKVSKLIVSDIIGEAIGVSGSVSMDKTAPLSSSADTWPLFYR